MNNRSNHTPTPEQIAACGAAVRVHDAKRALTLPHAVLIVDEQDPDGPHLFGPYDTRNDAAAVAGDFVETIEETEDVQVHVIPLWPITPPAPPRPSLYPVSG